MKTSVSLFKTGKNTATKDLNFICFGSPRCGTSMVAGAMVGLGINMGEDLPVNIEDPVFNLDGHRQNRPEFLKKVKQAIQKRATTGTVWGWKYPQAVEYLSAIKDNLLNPRLVIVYRDPVPATIRAGIGKEGQANVDEIYYKEIDKCIKLYRLNIELARKWQCPTLLVSYERASQIPEVFLQELSQFCDLKLPRDISKIIEFMAPGKYKNPQTLQR